MSKKSVTVSNILEKHDNPIAELVQMADITVTSSSTIARCHGRPTNVRRSMQTSTSPCSGA